MMMSKAFVCPQNPCSHIHTLNIKISGWSRAPLTQKFGRDPNESKDDDDVRKEEEEYEEEDDDHE